MTKRVINNASTQCLFSQELAEPKDSAQCQDTSLPPQKRIALQTVITPADSQAKENYENSKLHISGLLVERRPLCGMYPLQDLKERESDINPHFSLRISSQDELHKRRRIPLQVKEVHEIATNAVVDVPPLVLGEVDGLADCKENWIETRHPDYVSDSLAHMLTRQANFQPSADCFQNVQREITEAMRKTLIDWMAEVTYEYGKGLPALFLAINYLDRFLSRKCISKRQLQLLGTACLLLASKMEEIKPFSLKELVLASDNYCNEQQLVAMELIVLQALNFELSCPTLYEFVSFLFNRSQHPSAVVKQALHMAHSLLYDVSIVNSYFPFELAQKLFKLAVANSSQCLLRSSYSERDLLEFEIEHSTFQNMQNDDYIGLRRYHHGSCLLN